MKELLEYIKESVSMGGSKRSYLDIHAEEFYKIVKSTNIEEFIELLLKRSDIREMKPAEKRKFDELNSYDPGRFKKLKVFDGSMTFDIDLGELYIIVDNHLIRMLYGGPDDGKFHYCNMTELDTRKLERSEEQIALLLLKHTNIY